ncbi:MAG: hypothetical protein ACK5QW_02690 [Cyanobacteriota bacterium]
MDGNGTSPSKGTIRNEFLSGLESLQETTNVVRVAFGVSKPRRSRPLRPDHWATLVLPLQIGGGFPPLPPHAA